MDLWTGFMIGLFGSLHCIGMCGPITLALPVFSNSQIKVLAGRFLYNLGRVVTYSFMGLILGLFGKRIVLIGLQQQLSIFLGVIILLYLFLPSKFKNKFSRFKPYKIISDFIKTNFTSLLRRRSNSSLFLIGILNGFLPCGLVYVGLAGAISTGDFLEGGLYMFFFGMGTFPIMLVTSMAGKFINMNIKRRINKLIPIFAAILAIIFIMRGLNLGIPYISPKFSNSTTNNEVICN